MGCSTSSAAAGMCVSSRHEDVMLSVTASPKLPPEAARAKERKSVPGSTSSACASPPSPSTTAGSSPSASRASTPPTPQTSVSAASVLSSTPKYTIQEQLGKGAFGIVYAAVENDTQEVLAIKVLPLDKDRSNSTTLLKEAQHEAQVWSQVRQHPHVVELLRSYIDGLQFCFVMEQCRGGTLADRKNEFWKLPEHEIAKVFKEMILGVSHAHGCGVVHRDIKPSNFFLGGPQAKTVMLADFGLSAVLPKQGSLHGLFGTPPYMSPEMAGKRGHTASTDLWSFGASCYLLFMGQYPYGPATVGMQGRSKGDAFKESVSKNLVPPTFVRVDPAKAGSPVRQPSGSWVNLLKSLLDRDAQKRVTSDEAIHGIQSLERRVESDEAFRGTILSSETSSHIGL